MSDEDKENSSNEWGCTVMVVVTVICITTYFITRLFVA